MRFATILYPPVGSRLVIWIFPGIRRFRVYSFMRAAGPGIALADNTWRRQ